jgi:two-component system CheB/CheR fusion protein
LSVIRVNAAVLQRLPEATASMRIRSIAQAIERAIESQTRIIDDLLEFSRVRIGKLTLQRAPVDLVALLTELVETFSANLAACPVRLEPLPSGSLVCHADPVRLQQIAGNLLANAIKFTPARGQVTVRLSAEDGYARLMVADTGQGIAPEFLPHVFGLFQQADAGAMRQGGLGVGLALVQGLVLAHGGFVEAKSDGLGRGAEFNVWLPLLRPADE